MSLTQQPNSDIVNLPSSPRDVQEGVAPLTAEQQVKQLSDFFEDNYPEVFRSLVTDEGAEFRDAGQPVPADVIAAAERSWARTPDLISHSSLLVLGAGLDHRMPHVAQLPPAELVDAAPAWAERLPTGTRVTVIRPEQPLASGAVALSLHGGPGWFGDGESHDQFWLPLFAAIAQTAGLTVVDVVYPLPGYGPWDATQDAVRAVFDVVREEYAGTAPVGLLGFGSGCIAAQGCLPVADFMIAMTPRLVGSAAEAAAATGDSLREVPLLATVAALDTRGTSADEVEQWARAVSDRAEVQRWPSEHILAAPKVWRDRVAAIGEWAHQSLA